MKQEAGFTAILGESRGQCKEETPENNGRGEAVTWSEA